MTNQYLYEVRITPGAHFLASGQIAANLPNCNEMIISSKPFADVVVCEEKLVELLSSLSIMEAKLSEKHYVFVSKQNPMFDTTDKVHTDASTWDKSTLTRIYIADVEQLKKSELHYDILGQIKVAVPNELTRPALLQ